MIEPGSDSSSDPPSDLTSPYFEKVRAKQRELGWSDEELVAFASERLAPLDPYGRLRISTLDFLSRLTRTWQEALLQLMDRHSKPTG